jgi:hypothetical protein
MNFRYWRRCKINQETGKGKKMSKAGIIVLALVFLITVTTLSYSQKMRTSKNQQVIVETNGQFERGWLTKSSSGKKVFLNDQGQETELSDSDKIHRLTDMVRMYEMEKQRINLNDITDAQKLGTILNYAKEHCLYEQVIKLAEESRRLNPSHPDPSAKESYIWAKKKLGDIKNPKSSKNQITNDQSQTDFTLSDVQRIRFAMMPIEGNIGNWQVTFKGNVLKTFLNEMSEQGKFLNKEEINSFRGKSSTEQAQIIKRETGDKFQKEILIAKDPPLLLDYKRIVQPIISRSCGLANCHGGNVSEFKLASRATAIPQVYQNFHALDTYKGEQGRVIDHGQPEINSLLINYLLPQRLAPAGFSHKAAITPAIKSKSDTRFKQLLTWLKSMPNSSLDEILSNASSPTTQPDNTSTQPAVPNRE